MASMLSLTYPGEFPRASYGDLDTLPAGVVGEILFGELLMSPRPTPSHARASSKLAAILGVADRPANELTGSGDSGWFFVNEPEIRLDGDAVVPDIAAWRRERMQGVRSDYPDIAPDWVCEVQSPATARHDWTTKAEWYLKAGVRWYWIVDPRARTIRHFRATADGWMALGLVADHECESLEPFTTIAIPLGDLWLS